MPPKPDPVVPVPDQGSNLIVPASTLWYNAYPELITSDHWYCKQYFPITWIDEYGNLNSYGQGIVHEAQPIVGWRAWTNPNNWVSSKGATLENPMFNNIPDRIQFILWYHQKPYRTQMMGWDLYPIPDSTTRISGTQMSENAWNQLYSNVLSVDFERWPNDDP